MSEFKILNAKEEDLLTYPDFFAQAPLFNTLNQSPHPQSFDQNFISRMASRIVDKLVLLKDEPVFYISYRKSAISHPVDCMIYDPRVELDEEALITFIRQECFNRAGITQVHNKFDYFTCDTPSNESFLEKLGFNRVKNHRIMALELAWHEVTSWPSSHSGTVHIASVKTPTDMAARLTVQNGVFHNKKRIPLMLIDVQTEMRTKSYIPDLSLLMTLNDRPCGYGQIISNGSIYFLVNFGILPEYQGLGLAHLLLEDLLNRCENKEIPKVMLEVYEENLKAISLYEKHGFKTMYNKSLWSLR